ncbi:AlpA family phage regulatory protein [uncultured Thiodictyon sp.]|uniref:helix-turn-helix transcriptional regulator n=1 Tax=uncultured Thiodictyon sp. TaxID=1846217 RepID=UPI0025E5D1E4|nr:AlpA family phage regulatory protein [uncultured Thiodictyon sp.]
MANNISTPPRADSLLPIKEVLADTRQSRSALYRRIKAGQFPAPVQVGARSVAWRASDVASWIANLATGTRPAPIPSKG